MALTTYGKNLAYNYLYKSSATASPTLYVGLFTSDPTDSGSTVSEVSIGGYARQALSMASPVAGNGSNNTDISFPEVTSDWGRIAYIGIMDSSTGGNMIARGTITPRDVYTGDIVKILSGSLTLAIS